MELSGRLQDPAVLSSGKEPQYPLDERSEIYFFLFETQSTLLHKGT